MKYVICYIKLFPPNFTWLSLHFVPPHSFPYFFTWLNFLKSTYRISIITGKQVTIFCSPDSWTGLNGNGSVAISELRLETRQCQPPSVRQQPKSCPPCSRQRAPWWRDSSMRTCWWSWWAWALSGTSVCVHWEHPTTTLTEQWNTSSLWVSRCFLNPAKNFCHFSVLTILMLI